MLPFLLILWFHSKICNEKKNVTRKLFTTSWKMHTATPKKNSRLLSVLSRCCPKFQTTTFPSPPNNFPVRVYMFILHIYIKSNNKKTNFGVGLTVCVCMCVQLFLFSPKKGYFFFSRLRCTCAICARVLATPYCKFLFERGKNNTEVERLSHLRRTCQHRNNIT